MIILLGPKLRWHIPLIEPRQLSLASEAEVALEGGLLPISGLPADDRLFALTLGCVGDGTIIDGVRLLFYDASIASSSFTFLLLIFFFLPSFSYVLFICHQRLLSFFPLFLCRHHLILDSTFGIR